MDESPKYPSDEEKPEDLANGQLSHQRTKEILQSPLELAKRLGLPEGWEVHKYPSGKWYWQEPETDDGPKHLKRAGGTRYGSREEVAKYLADRNINPVPRYFRQDKHVTSLEEAVRLGPYVVEPKKMKQTSIMDFFNRRNAADPKSPAPAAPKKEDSSAPKDSASIPKVDDDSDTVTSKQASAEKEISSTPTRKNNIGCISAPPKEDVGSATPRKAMDSEQTSAEKEISSTATPGNNNPGGISAAAAEEEDDGSGTPRKAIDNDSKSGRPNSEEHQGTAENEISSTATREMYNTGGIISISAAAEEEDGSGPPRKAMDSEQASPEKEMMSTPKVDTDRVPQVTSKTPIKKRGRPKKNAIPHRGEQELGIEAWQEVRRECA